MQTKVDIYQSDSQIVRDAIDKVIVQFYRKKKENKNKSFLFTGCSAGCGTTNIAINIAIALANAGWKTVLIDSDMRKGMEYKRLNEGLEYGLSDYLLGVTTNPIYNTNIKNLDYIACGNSHESPVKLLCSKEMETLDKKLRDEYEYIIYDSPSIDIVPETEVMVPMVDNVILVVAVDETSTPQLKAAKAKVKAVDGKYMGTILNKLDISDYKHYTKQYDYFKTERLERKHKKDIQRILGKESNTVGGSLDKVFENNKIDKNVLEKIKEKKSTKHK